MSQSTTAPLELRRRADERVVDGRTAFGAESESDIGTDDVLGALDDESCRVILEATGEEALSATEISERCDVPLSTTYRKLERLTEAGLLEERTRIRRSGKHTSEYRRRVDGVVVSMDAAGGFELRVTPREGSEPERSEHPHPPRASVSGDR